MLSHSRGPFVSISVVLLLLIGCEQLVAQRATYRPETVQPHPEIVLPRIDTSQPLSLSQLRGKKVLLIHFASW